MGDIERELAARDAAGTPPAACMPGLDSLLTTDRAVADEKAPMRVGRGRDAAPMRARAADRCCATARSRPARRRP